MNRDALFALPDRTSCGTCTDGIDDCLEVIFSDRSRKQVKWALDMPVKQVKDLAEKLKALEAKLEKEFPPDPS